MCMFDRQSEQGIPSEQVCSCLLYSDSKLNIDGGFEGDSTRVTLKE